MIDISMFDIMVTVFAAIFGLIVLVIMTLVMVAMTILMVYAGISVNGMCKQKFLRLLGSWARENHWSLIDHKQIYQGFNMTYGAGLQQIFLVEVEAPDGRRRRGIVVCGGFFLGPLSDRVVARWDDGIKEKFLVNNR